MYPKIQSSDLIQIIQELSESQHLPAHIKSQHLSESTRLSDLTLDSVSVATLLTELEVRYDVETTEGDFTETMSLRDMAVVLQRLRDESSPPNA